MKYIVSCSCGKDYLAMVLCLIKKKLPYKQGKTVKDLEIKFNLENNKD